MTTPDHLTPLPAAAVHDLCDRLAIEIPASAYVIEQELLAWRETCTPHDGRRLANALRHVLKRDDLAREIEAMLTPLHQVVICRHGRMDRVAPGPWRS